jgi:hypothetical protein
MRSLSLITLIAALSSPIAQAADDCQTLSWMDVSPEDASIMASVRAQTTVLASMPDPYGRLDAEQLSQIQSVQPEGKKQYVCITSPRKVH